MRPLLLPCQQQQLLLCLLAACLPLRLLPSLSCSMACWLLLLLLLCLLAAWGLQSLLLLLLLLALLLLPLWVARSSLELGSPWPGPAL
jgi:hypothetical protein